MNDLVAETDRPAQLSKQLSIELNAERHFVGYKKLLGVLCGVVCSGVLEGGIGNECKSPVFFPDFVQCQLKN